MFSCIFPILVLKDAFMILVLIPPGWSGRYMPGLTSSAPLPPYGERSLPRDLNIAPCLRYLALFSLTWSILFSHNPGILILHAIFSPAFALFYLPDTWSTRSTFRLLKLISLVDKKVSAM